MTNNETRADRMKTQNNDNTLTALLTAYEIANAQHMHEHDRTLMKFNYFLVIELALLAAVFVQDITKWADITKYMLPSIGFVCSVIWLLSHQRGRVCYETKLNYVESLEKELAKLISSKVSLFLFNYFKENHKNYESNLTRRWDTEVVIMWFIIAVIIMWVVLLILFAIGTFNVSPPPP